MKHPVGQTKNGVAVYVDLIESRAAKHVSEQPRLMSLTAEALRWTTLDGAAPSVECDMGRAIGYDAVVETKDATNVFYVQLAHDKVYTRIIKNAKPTATQFLTLILHASEDGDGYMLDDVWIGRLRPPRPGDADATVDSKEYWEHHAVVFSDQTLQLRTITKVSPY